jgi:predicted dehydrogenase
VTRLRIVQAGAGSWGRVWLDALRRSEDVELVGLVDVDLGAARAHGLPVASTVTELLAEVEADAVLNATPPAAHHAVSTEALFLGLPVLQEKPAAPTVAEALSLAAASEVTGKLLMVSQSRRYFRHLAAYKERLAELGTVGFLACEFFQAPHFGGFREEMPYPLLVDMAIHPFDVARYLLDAHPVSVHCDSFNPAWSWFAGDAAVSAVFEFPGGTRFQYTGSWCSPEHETSWNGHWRASTAAGTALWDGEGPPTGATVLPDAPEELDGSLAEFVRALRAGAEPWGEIHQNVGSLAMVEAAVRSAEARARARMDDVLAAALDAAIAGERREEVRARLEARR